MPYLSAYTFSAMIMILSFLAVRMSLPVFITFMMKESLVDSPNERASHSVPTPTSGGITFLIGILLSLFFVSDAPEAVVLIMISVIISIIGFWDDIKDIRASLRLMIQLIIAVILYNLDIKIDNFHGLLGINEIPDTVAIVFNLLVIVSIINAYNLIDGINGLASGLGLIATAVFGLLFLMVGDYDFAILAFSLAGSLIGFLKYNFHRASVFMGDTGSLIIGVCMAVFFIRTFNMEQGREASFAIAIVIIPFIDMVKVFALRILKGHSPFKADKIHLHHQFLKLGDSHRIATVSIYLFQLVLLILTLMLQALMVDFHLSAFFIAAAVLVCYAVIDLRTLLLLKRKRKELVNELEGVKAKNQLLKIK